MQDREKTRILIAGAGPVGLAAAIELSRRGYRPRLVDRDAAPSPESRALAINPRTLDLLEASGASERLLAAGLRLVGLRVRFGRRQLFRVDVSRLAHRFNFILALPQSRTEAILAETLADLGGRLERNVEVQDVVVAGNGFACTVAGAPADADLLIGADGAHSTVRKGLGIGFGGDSVPDAWGLADVELDDWPFPWNELVGTFGEDRVVGFIPLREGFGRFVSSRPDTLNALPPDARVRKVVWQTEFRISYRQAETYQHGNAFLAGDAAHIHSPLGGRGMNLGIEDAAWLAWLIAQGRAAEYTALRHPPGAHVLATTRAPTRLFSSKSVWSRLLRDTILPPIMALPPVQRRLLPRIAGLDTPAAPWLAEPETRRRPD